jgi:hypothetical protein
MALLTYQDVRPWARAIKQRVSLREMPPWFIDKDIGIQKFKDDPSLNERGDRDDRQVVGIKPSRSSGSSPTDAAIGWLP